MSTHHQITIGNSRRMPELEDNSIELMVTSPPYLMIQMWDELFCESDQKIAALWRKLERGGDDGIMHQIYDLVHQNLAEVWAETYRVLTDGGIAALPKPRTHHRDMRKNWLHSTTLHALEETHQSPKYKGKGAFLGSGFLPPMNT